MRRRHVIFLILIVIVGSSLRLYRLASLSMWYDEGGVILGSTYVDKCLSWLRPSLLNQTPLNPPLVRLWYTLVSAVPGLTPGSKAFDYLLRLFPCIAGIICIPLTFSACRHILKEAETALIAAFLFAISPFQIYYAQEFRCYTMYVALSLGALIFMVKALETDEVRYWVGLACCLVVGMYVHYFTVWTIAVVNLYFAATFTTHRRLLRKWVVCQCVVCLLCIPAGIYISWTNRFLALAEEHWFPRPDRAMAFITFKTFFAGYSPNALLYRTLLVVCGALSVLGLYALRKKRGAFILVAILAFVPIAANLIISQISSYPYYTHRMLIFFAIPFYILVALGVRALRKPPLIGISIALIAGLTVPCLADHYSQRLHRDWRHRLGARYKVQNREAAHYIAANLQEGDFVAHNSHFTLCPFMYYLPSAEQKNLSFTDEERIGIMRSYPNVSLWERTGFFPVRVESVTATAKRLWLVTSWWEPFELDPLSKQLRGWFDGHCLRKERRAFDGLTVYLYKNDPELRALTETHQIADYGEVTVPYYRFPRGERGVDAGTGWKQRFLAGFPSSMDEQIPPYNVQFDFAVADGDELALRGRGLRVDFADRDGDGERETLCLTETDTLLREGGTARLGPVDYSVLALDGDPKRALLASFPMSAADDFAYEFVVRNASRVRRTIHCRTYESACVIEPLSFNRCDAQSDTWRPTLQHNFRPPPVSFNRPAMVARLSADSQDGDAIYRDIRLDAGRYVVFARILQENLMTNRSRANIRFAVTSPESDCTKPGGRLIGIVAGNDPAGRSGWTWRRVGDFQCGGGERFRLVVAAYNDDSLPEAYFDIDRVMFVPIADVARLSPVETAGYDLTLGPLEEKRFTLSSRLGERQSKRIDIELFDPETGEFRNIFFRVRRDETQTGSAPG